MLTHLFGHGDDDGSLWLLAVRVNILLFLVTLLVAVGVDAVRARWRGIARAAQARSVLVAAALLTVAATGLRFAAAANLLDQGGIPYSRLLLGYRGNLATAQAYSLVYTLAGRDLGHAILLDRLAGSATVPLLFVLARSLKPASLAFPVAAAGLLAFSPVHIHFSASDALSVFSGFLCALAYVAVARDRPAWLAAGVLGLALLTQVRYEDTLLLVPPLVFLAVRRRWGAAALVAAAAVVYVPFSLHAGISFQDHARPGESWRFLASDAVLFDPFLGIPLLLAGALLVGLCRRPLLLAAAIAPFLAAAGLASATSESPHDAARVFSNWLVPVSIAAGYGFSLLAGAGHLGRVAAAAVGLFVVSRPVAMREALRARYLEIAEHDAFAAMLAAAPADVAAVVVPDDEIMRRTDAQHRTIETFAKYRSIRAGLPGRPPRLAGITWFLERGGKVCAPGRCLFFDGLPCQVESPNHAAPGQCEALAREHVLEPVASETVTAAPFAECSIATGERRRAVCDPTVRTVTFSLARIR